MIYVTGFIIGIIGFLYFVSVINDGKDKIQKYKNTKSNKQAPDKITSDQISYSNLKIAPGERICPLCRSPLTKFEPLHASRINASDSEKLFIHGCKYCYKDN
jgi:hypothetical protein